MSSKPRNFSQALEDLENLSTNTARDIKDRLQGELNRLEEAVADLKPQIEEIKDRVQHEASRAKNKVEKQVKTNPWTSIGIVGLIAFVIGFLVAMIGMKDRD